MSTNKKLSLEELDRLEPEAFHAAPKLELVVVLDNVRSMHNVGAVFRTSDAFRIKEILLCGFTPLPPHRDIRKVAIGATETVSWRHETSALDAISELQAQGFHLISIEQTEQSVSLAEFMPDPKGKYAVVFGNEVDGVNQEIVDKSDTCIEIAQFGTKHSLNVSVCAGIVLWSLSKAMDFKD